MPPAACTAAPPVKGPSMGQYILRRLVLIVPTLFGISVMVFLLMRLIPGDVIDMMIGPELIDTLTQEERETLLRMFGLDAPLHIQYLRWISGVLQGDLGVSLRSSQPVSEAIFRRLGVTAELAFLSVICSTIIAVPLGVLAAMRRNSFIDVLVNAIGLLGVSIPTFWLATLLLFVASGYLQWRPALIWVSPFQDPVANLQQMLLPVLSLSGSMIAVVMRMTRSSMLEVLGQDYIRTAYAKGLREQLVMSRHALKNSLIPVLTVIGLQIGGLLSGAVVIEQIFGLPGIGWMLLNAISQRDYPLVQGTVLFIAFTFVMVNLFVDLLYSYVDPRIRFV
jgi:peptide/nickel transport system permease protein